MRSQSAVERLPVISDVTMTPRWPLVVGFAAAIFREGVRIPREQGKPLDRSRERDGKSIVMDSR
jgi:hypothetical protein